MTDLIPYGRQYLDKSDIEAVVEVLNSPLITQGPMVQRFEDALAEYCGTKYAVVFNSGTAALHAAYYAAGVSGGHEVVTSPITFVATANAALYLGARPVFVDVEPDTGNIDPSLIERAVTPATRVIAPVHYAGHPADMDAITAIARRRGLAVVEDASHALGAQYAGRHVGTQTDMATLSFHPVKHITTGEGGAVITNDETYRDRLLLFRNHGITREGFEREPRGPWYYEMQDLGYNYRLTDLQCALGLSQLRKLDGFVARRREIVAAYNEGFAGNNWFETPPERDYGRSSWHLYPVRLSPALSARKGELMQRLRDRGIGTQVHYIPVYTQPYYRRLGYEEGLCPRAEEFYRRELSLPLYPAMGSAEVATVMKEVMSCLQELENVK